MSPTTPPPLPQPRRVSLNRLDKLLIGLGLILVFLIGALIVLRIFGLIYPFLVPTGAMAPAVSAGDHVVMEGITFLVRNPRRGDIVAFKGHGIASLGPETVYIKRVAGLPGEQLRFSRGNLFVNDKRVVL